MKILFLAIYNIFSFLQNWEVYIADEQFWSRLHQVERYLANQEGKRRGWYSYTELDILITVHELSALKELIKVSTYFIFLPSTYEKLLL